MLKGLTAGEIFAYVVCGLSLFLWVLLVLFGWNEERKEKRKSDGRKVKYSPVDVDAELEFLRKMQQKRRAE